ncbi:hypothetical protein RCL1_005524 [Eukaryota sp. TZLM3-RCL]
MMNSNLTTSLATNSLVLKDNITGLILSKRGVLPIFIPKLEIISTRNLLNIWSLIGSSFQSFVARRLYQASLDGYNWNSFNRSFINKKGPFFLFSLIVSLKYR